MSDYGLYSDVLIRIAEALEEQNDLQEQQNKLLLNMCELLKFRL